VSILSGLQISPSRGAILTPKHFKRLNSKGGTYQSLHLQQQQQQWEIYIVSIIHIHCNWVDFRGGDNPESPPPKKKGVFLGWAAGMKSQNFVY
jgi:hypothetical protein